MIKRGLFRKPNLALESAPTAAPAADVPERLLTACPACKAAHFSEDLESNLNVCPACGHHLRISGRRRIGILCDEGTFEEHDGGLSSQNLIDFPEYERKLASARRASGEREAVICGVGRVGGFETAVFAMEPGFMMGSMGSVVGEKITRLFETAAKRRLPVIGCTVSGGARMQEGMLSLIQMAKVSGAVRRHGDLGLLYIALLTDPTTGGVTASFAMEGDIILAEPKALIGFAGPRVIEQTTRTKLPAGFQRAEFMLSKGFIDAIVERTAQKEYLQRLLRLHSFARAEGGGGQ
ncbi:MAG: acetyl-CoA carboxylase, carboxyltransferase subunit beta [Oscillospiraceae bacterium]|jgi:acetyl-CoA carboxylase carboxyl transferase subunit beta|nr:acetyl-CoA carboxylase, carboxyltransferase subunit beta [Oscillospiraceae bacterium]